MIVFIRIVENGKTGLKKIARASVSSHHEKQRQDRLSYDPDFSFFVPSSAIQNHRQFGNNPEILMKSICINSSANLTQTSENSTKTKFANCAKDSLLMYLLIHLVFAWRRLAYDIYIWWNEVVNLFDICLSVE